MIAFTFLPLSSSAAPQEKAPPLPRSGQQGDELTRHWNGLTPADRDAVMGLLRQSDNLKAVRPVVLGAMKGGDEVNASKLVAAWYDVDESTAEMAVMIVAKANGITLPKDPD